MSDHSIISRDAIRTRARAAFTAGRGRDSHNMNPGAAALATWLEEYDRLTNEHRHDLALESRRATRIAKGLPQLHAAPAAGKRVDARQVGA